MLLPRFRLTPLVVVLGSMLSAPPTLAQSDATSVGTATRLRHDISAGPLAAALNRFALHAGVELSFDPVLVAGRTSAGLRGEYGVEDGFAALLAGSGLRARRTAGGTWALQVKPDDATLLPGVKVQAQTQVFAPPAPARGLHAGEQASATKSTLSVRETPQAISVVTRESIEARQSRDINSALELSAGVTTSGSAFAGGNPRTGESFTLRGQELNALRDLRIDGFASAADRNVLDLAPFERVDVIKGPASMLYGQGSLGGFINLVRKKPQAERSLRVVAQGGSFDTWRTEIDATGALDKNERLLGQLAFAYEDSGSFIDHVDSRRVVLAPTVEWQLGERTRAQLAFLYQEDRFRPSLGIDLVEDGDELVIPEVPRSRFFGVPNSEDSEARMRHTTLRVDHQLSDRWLTSLLLHNSYNRLLGIADGYAYGVDEAGNTNLYSSFVAHDNESWAGELRLDGRFDAFGREHHLLLGVEANRREEIGWGGGGYTVVGSGNIYTGIFEGGLPGHDNPRNYDFDGSDSNKGAYAQLLLSLTDRTRLLLGARYDRLRQDQLFTPVGTTPEPFDKNRKSEASARLALTQDIGAGVTAYGSWAQSFNPVFERSRNGILDPETGEGYELGLKGEWLDGTIGATLAVFRQELDNRPIPDPDNGPSEDFSISAGLQRSDGVELELAGRPLPGLDLQFAAAWLDAEYVDRLDPNYDLTPGGTVERQTSLYAAYELQSGALKGLGFGATVVSVGDRIVLSGQNFIVKGYERYDLHAFYRGLPQWNFSLLVRNLSDERYIEQVNSAYQYAHFFGSPRAVMLRVEYRFAVP